MNPKNIFQLKKKITCRQPRSWDIHTRYAMVYTGEKMALEPGTWLLEKGEVEYKLSDGLEKEYLYRLATGEMVALDRPLATDEAELIDDPQIISAMNAFRTLEEAAYADWGVHIEHIHPLPPFGLIKCPLCGHTNFSSVDFAGVWCDFCNAKFEVNYTAGDPGWVVDCCWENVDWTVARYLIPKSRNLGMRMVFKNAADPRDMEHAPGDQPWYEENYGCTPESPRLTGEEAPSLRPGLHLCNLGDVYDWRIDGRAPSWVEMLEGEKNRKSWNVDGVMWPAVAYLPLSTLTYSEESTLRLLRNMLRELKEDDPHFPLGRHEVLATLEGLVARSRPKVGPLLGRFDLPLLVELDKDERYMLHHWLVLADEASNLKLAYPVWYVVRPVLGEESFGFRPINGWTVVRRDICPCCGDRVLPEDYQKLQKRSGKRSYKIAHHNCLHSWKAMGWTLQLETAEKEMPESSPACLPVFEGWTVDLRLKEFRRVGSEENREQGIDFLPFNSAEGDALLERYIDQQSDRDELRKIFKAVQPS